MPGEPLAADSRVMGKIYSGVAQGWDWRRSAQARLFSLGFLWLMVFGAGLLPLVPLLAGARMAFSGAQLFLNRTLAKRSPLASRDRYDWALLGLAFAGSIAVAAIAGATGNRPSAALLLVLLPYSGLQLRSYRRSLAAYAVRQPLAFPALSESERLAA